MVVFGMKFLPVALVLLLRVQAHSGDHGHQIPIAPEGADWMTRHMIEEHHITGFDPETFFTLHDFHSTGTWSTGDIRRMYGLFDKSSEGIDEEHKLIAVQHILDFYDSDKSGDISKDEFLAGIKRGQTLPDLGFGPGHHGDEEYEYEIHHWEKYHGDDTKEEDLTHPEDIAHFQREEENERRQEALKQLMADNVIVEANIPKKFLRADL